MDGPGDPDMKHYLNRKYRYGVQGDLTAQDFKEVSAEEYDDVLDLRYEGGEWQQ